MRQFRERGPKDPSLDDEVDALEEEAFAQRDDYDRPIDAVPRPPGKRSRVVERGALPGPVRARMEGAFGVDFSGVRVHEGSASTPGVRAYTEGDDIHFAPGEYDPASPRGLELLGHELAHVVQQRAGRVSADHDPDLEREADLLGARAAAFTGRAKARTPAAGRAAPGLRQCKVGFELETIADHPNWRVQGKAGANDWAQINHTKKVLLWGPNNRAGIGSDLGHVEFITAPLATWDDVVAARADLEHLVGAVRGNYVFTDGQNLAARAVSGMDQHRIHGGPGPMVKPQATLGIDAAHLSALFERLLTERGRADRNAAERRRGERPSASDDARDRIASGTTVAGMGEVLEWSRLLGERAAVAAGASRRNEEVCGFLASILKTLGDAHARSGGDLDDPKYAFSLMPRTDHATLYRSLEPEARRALDGYWHSMEGLFSDLESVCHFDRRSPVFLRGYRPRNGGQLVFGPTIQDWLNSVFGGGPDALIQSRLEGWAPEANEEPQGIGAMGTDPDNRKLGLYELRAFAGGANVQLPIADCMQLILELTKIVAEVTSDAGLAPR